MTITEWPTPGHAATAAPAMISVERARALALGLPEAVERDHHGRPSFRVAGKIFATLWDERHMNIMLDEPGILTAVQNHSDACGEVWWGKRLSAVSLSLERADEALAAELLADAWERRAPERLLTAGRIAHKLPCGGIGARAE